MAVRGEKIFRDIAIMEIDFGRLNYGNRLISIRLSEGLITQLKMHSSSFESCRNQ